MRSYGLALRGAILKVNTEELARLLNLENYENWTAEECALHGKQLAQIIQGPILITRGTQGMQYVSVETTYHSDALQLAGKLDPVGAGDTAVAAFTAAAGAKVPIPQALKLANLAAAITVQKQNQTGTATQEEIMELVKRPMYAES